MTMPKIVREMLEQALAQEKENERQNERVHMRAVDFLAAKGLRLSPCGLESAGIMARELGDHYIAHNPKDNDPPIEFILDQIDDFIALWAMQRLEEDPDYLNKGKKALCLHVVDMFQDEVPDLKVV